MRVEKHRVFRFRVSVPAVKRLHVHGRQFPMLQWVGIARHKPPQLLLARHRKPKFKQMHTAINQHPLQFRRLAHKQQIFLRRAKSHHPLHPRAVIPRAVKKHHLARGGQILNITLKIPLSAFHLRGFFQRHNPRATRVQMLHKTLNRAAFARRITPFKQTHNPLPAVFHPALHFQQLNLQFLLFRFIHPTAHPLIIRIIRRQRRTVVIFLRHRPAIFHYCLFKYFQTILFIPQIHLLKRLQLMTSRHNETPYKNG